MAIKLVKFEYGAYNQETRNIMVIREFMVDSNDDFQYLPKSDPGSTALSPTGDMMMVNASGEWVAFGG